MYKALGGGSSSPARPSRGQSVDRHVLVLCAHGTNDPGGAGTTLRIARRVRRIRPDLEVAVAYADLQRPHIADVVRHVEASGRHAVVVPLMLGAGYHLQVDLAAAVSGTESWVTAPLGPHGSVGQALRTRLVAAGVGIATPLVLGAPGSRQPKAIAQVHAMSEWLRAQWQAPVVAGFTSAALPRVEEAVQRLRTEGVSRVAVASYVLGRGPAHQRMLECGADVVTDPLDAHPAVVHRAVALFDAGIATPLAVAG